MALPLHALPALRGGLFALLGATATGALAMVFGEPLPSAKATLALLAIGASGYGLSLRFYLLAQRADAGRGGAASRGVACPRTRARGAGARTCAPPRRRTSRSRTRHDAGGGAQSLAQARANASCPFPCSRRASHASPLRRDRRLDIGAAASLRSLVASWLRPMINRPPRPFLHVCASVAGKHRPTPQDVAHSVPCFSMVSACTGHVGAEGAVTRASQPPAPHAARARS